MIGAGSGLGRCLIGRDAAAAAQSQAVRHKRKNRTMKKYLLLSLLIVTGCASNSGVVPIGPETFMVSRQAATGFSGLGTLKAEAFQEANQYCIKQNKNIRVVNTSESSPPYVLGNFPRAEVQFMCLDKSDAELTRPKMQKHLIQLSK